MIIVHILECFYKDWKIYSMLKGLVQAHWKPLIPASYYYLKLEKLDGKERSGCLAVVTVWWFFAGDLSEITSRFFTSSSLSRRNTALQWVEFEKVLSFPHHHAATTHLWAYRQSSKWLKKNSISRKLEISLSTFHIRLSELGWWQMLRGVLKDR